MTPIRTLGAAAAAAACLLLAACTGGAVTTTPSASPSASPSPEPAAERAAAWTLDMGSESWTTPAIDGDLAYVGANDGVVRAVNHRTGVLEWELATGGDVRGEVAVGADANYVVSDDGLLYAFDDAGEVLWKTRLSKASDARADYNNYGSRPTIADGVVYAAGEGGVVVAVAADDGAVEWRVDLGSPVEVNLLVANGRLHVGTMGRKHFALDIANGDVVWELRTLGAVTTNPGLFSDTLVVGSRSANLQAREEATGERVWTVKFGGSWIQSGTTALGADALVVGSSDYRMVRAFTIADGTQRWAYRTVGWPWAQPAVADGVVYANEVRLDYQLPWDSSVAAIDGETGELLWYANTGDSLEWVPGGYATHGVAAGAAVTDSYVLVAGLDGVLYAFDR